MKTLRKLITFCVMAGILASGLPLFHRGDANRDRSVSLEDVILHIRELAKSLNQDVPFASKVENTLSSLYAVAGLKTSIQPDKCRTASALFSIDFPLSHCSQSIPLPAGRACRTDEPTFFYHSIASPPSTPPPKSA